MKTVLFIHGGKVEEGAPSRRFLLRLEWAVEYYRKNHKVEDITFLVSGRWGRVTDNFLMTEAEVGKRYILQELPDAKVIKEDISVEIIGNYAFSKPLLKALQPGNVIIVTSEVLQDRVRAIAKEVFAEELTYEFQFLHDEWSGNPTFLDKEEQALKLFNNLFAEVKAGDDMSVRDILLYKTPYYFKGLIEDKAFFDMYWEGGFEHYLASTSARNNR